MLLPHVRPSVRPSIHLSVCVSAQNPDGRLTVYETAPLHSVETSDGQISKYIYLVQPVRPFLNQKKKQIN